MEKEIEKEIRNVYMSIIKKDFPDNIFSVMGLVRIEDLVYGVKQKGYRIEEIFKTLRKLYDEGEIGIATVKIEDEKDRKRTESTFVQVADCLPELTKMLEELG